SYLQNKTLNVKLSLPGYHNIYNAAAAMAVSWLLRIEDKHIKNAIESFMGIKRRFEKRGIIKGADIYHDYAHHPSEIRAVIESAKKMTKSRLIVVFQPHTFSRTALLFNDFVEVLKETDLVFILKEYSAREIPSQGKSAFDLYEKLKLQCKAEYFDKTLPLAKQIMNAVEPFDTVLVLGAGDVDKLCDILISPKNL
ncbi:MAG: glutamate ligase domain-containing protein, partial [Bacillota bacterium]